MSLDSVGRFRAENIRGFIELVPSRPTVSINPWRNARNTSDVSSGFCDWLCQVHGRKGYTTQYRSMVFEWAGLPGDSFEARTRLLCNFLDDFSMYRIRSYR
ncbi:hypothetical protein SERLA73DRAFT_184905 [Serpula lacrymans var. lacrymans S7.3]|uniref:Uncharacterized protein n=2 Tax=Serpula lacrymans var. lacrymans TaxID=341189 RepID=F8Q5B8_SERL3|nr:uncharacterized protein SERLADRAFT_473079 [Serpula lacrymans var. lacrymans S7.9]EGN96745.1 hypothetical protein SERLA73DRAFT_184905 [Serpula lacrymans var. lacrymans S7.3]EGO22353.1 hypothetical protein SERLADRAFT_473079 [Serpula lacrymans var. lacrymans S7.9]